VFVALERCLNGRIRASVRARFSVKLRVGRIFVGNLGFVWFWDISRRECV
jgi:hypothetical protein